MIKEIIKHPAWFRHGITVILAVVGGALMWNDLHHNVTNAADKAKENQKAITDLKGSVNRIDKKQGIIVEQLEDIERSAKDRSIEQLRRHNETTRSLDRIFDKLDNRSR